MHVSDDTADSADLPETADTNGEELPRDEVRPGDISHKVRKGGGDAVTAERLEQINKDIVENLASSFLETVTDELPEMEELIAVISVGDSWDDEIPHGFRRHIHDLRGMGASFGYPLVSEIAGQIHGIIHRYPMATAEQFAAIRVHMDAFKLVLVENLKAEGGARGDEIMAGLRKVFLKITAPDA